VPGLRIALVSREVSPLHGGGIGQFVASAARLLSRIAEVTIVTTSLHEQTYEHLRAQRDTRLPGNGVRVAFVQEPSPEEATGWYDPMQCYSARVLERLRELYPNGGPDLVEFPDFLAEGFVTVQAARALDAFLERTCVCVRIHTSTEVTEVINGHLARTLPKRALYAMERHTLAHADRVIWPLGDVLELYRRFYGSDQLARAVRIAYPYDGPSARADADRDYEPQAPLRILYAGRLEHRKGVADLIRAARGLEREDFNLTLVGGDSPTAPLGTSMAALLRLEVADDARFELRLPADRAELGDVIREHDVVAVPSSWECGPYVALEALHCNRPLLATPVGGLTEIVAPGVSGWLTEGTDRAALGRALELVLDDRDGMRRLVRNGQLVAHARALCDEREILRRYRELAALEPRRRPTRARATPEPPLVSAVVPYYRASRYVAQTIQSLLAQTHPRLEIVLVNDGSFDEQDWVIAELAARAPIVVISQVNSGLGAARNFGISQSRGRYVFPLDADNIADPRFVERCVEMLEHRSELAYVSSWSRYIDEQGRPSTSALGYQPLGNRDLDLLGDEDVAGDAAAVLRRSIFDLGFRYSEELAACEDWHFYRQLSRAGQFGEIIPERLLLYRLRSDSMQSQIGIPKRARILGEIEGLLRESAMQWTVP
jgi:glycogen(starch) synthase